VLARQQPLRVGEAGPGGVLERAQRLGAQRRRERRGARLRLAQHQLGKYQPGAHDAFVVCVLVPARQRVLAAARDVERDVAADQLPRLGAVLARGAVEPMERGRQVLGQSGAAEQVQLA
jgi:hypothetical protein